MKLMGGLPYNGGIGWVHWPLKVDPTPRWKDGSSSGTQHPHPWDEDCIFYVHEWLSFIGKCRRICHTWMVRGTKNPQDLGGIPNPLQRRDPIYMPCNMYVYAAYWNFIVACYTLEVVNMDKYHYILLNICVIFT